MRVKPLKSWILQWYFSGDGGNDVSMIQAADCGIGIEGKVLLLVSLSSVTWFLDGSKLNILN